MLNYRAILLLCLFAASPLQALESSLYRSQQNLYVLGEYGSAIAPMFTAGVSAGVKLSRDMALEFSYAQGERDVDYAKMYGQLYSAKFKKYWGNSFYTNTGLAYRRVADETTKKASEIIYVERHGTSTGIDMSIGNRWQFDQLTVGCDWLGFFHPLTTTRTESCKMMGQDCSAAASARAHGGGGARPTSAEDQGRGGERKSFDRHQTDWDRLSKHGTFQLLRLSLGLAF